MPEQLMSPAVITITCPDCGGEGTRGYPSDRSPAAYYYVGTCEQCEGSGVIEVEEAA